MIRIPPKVVCFFIGHRFPQHHFDLPERLTCQRCGWFDRDCAINLLRAFKKGYRKEVKRMKEAERAK